jgi:predicted RNA binding protein YcfA (HicA-like mRNA interferase family)
MPSYNYRKLTKKLKQMGFKFYRQGKGSHTLWIRESDKVVLPIPNHGGKDLRTGTLHEICKEIGLKNVHDLEKI